MEAPGLYVSIGYRGVRCPICITVHNDAQLIYANLTQRFVLRCLYAMVPIACDTVYFDENSKGTWEVLETVRKAYLTFKRD